MLHDAFRNCNSGAMIRLRGNDGLFNLKRLKARTKVSLLLLREVFFADDCALIAHNEDELQSILNDFPRVASRYGLTISMTKTEVMPQPKLGSSFHDPVIKIACCTTDCGQIMVLASAQILVYIKQLSVLTMLFLDLVPPSAEKNLDQFHLKFLRKVCGISWKDRIPTTTVLELFEIEGIEAFLIKGQLRRAVHLTRMEENRIPKALFYGELFGGQRPRGGKHKRYKNVFKYNLKACDVPIETWEKQALNRPQ